jgi:hypothetical protein
MMQFLPKPEGICGAFGSLYLRYALCHFLTDIDIVLWSKVKAKATLERKTMREVIFESLKWYVTPVETPATAQKKGKRKG